MDLYLRYLFLAFYFIATYAKDCSYDFQCQNKYAVCSLKRCACKFGGIFSMDDNSCNECVIDSDCSDKFAECSWIGLDRKCRCKYGKGHFTDSNCRECNTDSDCSDKFAKCSLVNTCSCKHGNDFLAGKCKECTIDFDCQTAYSECNWDNKCVCKYGGDLHLNGKLTSCSANTVGIVVGVIVSIVVVSTVILIFFIVRRRRLQRLNQTRTAVWVQSAGAVQGLPVAPQPYQPTYPVQQYQPVATNQGHVNDGYAHSQPAPPPYTHEANK